MPNANLTNAQWAVVSIEGKDRLGNKAALSNITITNDATNVASIEAFGEQYKLTGLTAGTAKITIKAKNAAGIELTAILDVTITAELAVSIEIFVGQVNNI